MVELDGYSINFDDGSNNESDFNRDNPQVR